MKSAVLFSALPTCGRTRTKSVDAIAEVDEHGNPVAAEVLWFQRQLGLEDSESLLAAFQERGINHSYSDDVDALTLSFGEADRSYGQDSGVLVLIFEGLRLVKAALDLPLAASEEVCER